MYIIEKWNTKDIETDKQYDSKVLRNLLNKKFDDDNEKTKIKRSIFHKLFSNKQDDLNTLGKKVRFIITKNLKENLKALLVYDKSHKIYFAPKITLETSFECSSQDELITKMISFSFKYYEYIYDINFIGCCLNPILSIDGVYNFVLTENEWGGSPVKPRPPAYPYLDHLIWWEPYEAIHNIDYAKTFTLGDETLNVIKVVLKSLHGNIKKEE